MKLKIYQVDAFTEHLFHGNPAAVIPLEEWLSDAVMQNISAENNLAETAFFVKEGEKFRIRWFTPSQEVELCGHATLATAHVLYNHLSYNRDHCTFQTQERGDLIVSRNKHGLAMDFPADKPHELPTYEKLQVQNNLGVDLVEVLKGTDDYLTIVKNARTVLEFRPDLNAISKLKARGVILSAPNHDTYDFVSRCFFPKYGIAEDPVTGSAHTLLTTYWAGKLGKSKMIALQASVRTGVLSCTLVGDRVHLAGNAVTYLIGEISVL